VTHFPLARRASRRFVAGEKLADALAVTRTLKSQGLMTTLDLLGENVHSPAAAVRAADEYIGVLDAVREAGLESHISLKLTQLGLDQGKEVALANLRRILEVAKAMGTFVRIDMEDSSYTERTLEVFRLARADFDNVGVVLQAYLKRSLEDVAELNGLHGRVRLCKGAYNESGPAALKTRSEVTENTKQMMRALLLEGTYPAIASHDEEIIREAIRISRENRIPSSNFEFQMLYGIRRERQVELRNQGYNVRVYVPFGVDWYPYFMRRLAERPANLVFFLTALFKG
jgi:proline dehydrogenase